LSGKLNGQSYSKFALDAEAMHRDSSQTSFLTKGLENPALKVFEYEVIWGHIDILVFAVRSLSRNEQVKTLLASSSPTIPMKRRSPTPLFPTRL